MFLTIIACQAFHPFTLKKSEKRRKISFPTFCANDEDTCSVKSYKESPVAQNEYNLIGHL